MATTQLGDIQLNEVLTAYVKQQIVEKNAFVQSGIMTASQLLDTLLAGQGIEFGIPHWNPLNQSERPNASSTDPTDIASPKKLTSGKQKCRRLVLSQGWSAADLVASLAGEDPLADLGDQLAEYWNGQIQAGLINTCLGILADNDANDDDDMIFSVATDDAGAVTDAERIDGDAFVDAQQTMGDAKTKIAAVAMHSVPHSKLQKAGLLVDNFDPQTGEILYQTYLGKRVIVDDGLPAIPGTNRIKYTSILFGAGAFGLGVGTPKTPEEVERAASQGNGHGVETLWSRRELIIHPTGFAWNEGTIAGENPTLDELSSATHWSRVFDRKNVPLAFLQTNG